MTFEEYMRPFEVIWNSSDDQTPNTYVIGNPGPLTDDEIDALYQEEPLEIGF